ncbi:MAG: hypothetical protein ABH880_02255 [Patescibacteria group bacterium]
MQLSREEIEEFQTIYKKEFGKEISYEEASESAHNLVNFFSLLLDIDRRNKNRRA